MMSSKVVSGISSCFQLLSQSQGQIAHVLLTRSPLVYPRRGLTVRLACVKHAASVRPEPGSNSPLKSIQNPTPICERRFVCLNYVRSLIKRPNAGSICQSIKGTELGTGDRQAQVRGFFVHYLALTFSTLLSSQVSGAHLAGVLAPAWGNSTNVMRSSKFKSNPNSLYSIPLRHKPPDR